MNRLPEADQRRIEQAADRNERLAIVKELRQNDWIARLPQADREAVAALPESQRSEKLAALRKEDRRRRQEWVDWANARRARPTHGRPARAPCLRRRERSVADFAKYELTREDRANLHLAEADPAEKHEILRQEYFKRHPEALQKYRRK